QQLIAAWRKEEQAPFAGWDFSYLDGRMIEEKPPWSYLARAAELMDGASSVLDMGTGGGERLLRLRERWPDKVAVTEDYPPNVALARERLEPLGVTVVEVALEEEIAMPFAGGEFDLVLNRHSGLNPSEVARILAPGGTFLTQQVHGLWAHDLIAHFGAPVPWPNDTPGIVAPRLEAAGLEVATCLDWTGKLTFTDAGAIVYYLKAIPWLVPGFSVATHVEYLLALHERLERGEELVFAAEKYLIEARKPRAVGG
ncbi:MAG TPA: methyltransferase domain-containing protein, partial [Anaerolineae bacterium]|nr:methyltransferase domain-containing protein [Anaerolineae bacterium]